MSGPGRESIARPILLGWLFAALLLCLINVEGIAGLRFPDPDDAMRLLEVRDWLGGQSFYDVAQHRLAGGAFAMHWSRLVDLPLAAVMLLADPLVGEAVSDRVAMVTVPLLTLLLALALIARLTRRVAGREVAILSVLVAPLSPPLVYQLMPMRIDHHGWQAALSLAASCWLLDRPTTRNGVLAGLALGTLLTVSLEGLPFVAAVIAIAALAWVIDRARGRFLAALTATSFTAALALHVATRGPGMWLPACDAMAPGWLAALGVAAAAIGGSVAAAPRRRWVRLLLLGAGGIASLLALRAVSPGCLHGPFASLDPLVRTFWYDQVLEGLPLWKQSLGRAVVTVALPLVGLGVTARMAWVSEGEARTCWLLLGALLGAATLVACMVNRAGVTANALGVPGSTLLLASLLRRARAVPQFGRRVMATVLALFSASPGLVVVLIPITLSGLGAKSAAGAGPGAAGQPACERFEQVRALGALPPATIFLPLDVTPDLIATTRHRAIAGGYHRNAGAMSRVITAFTAAPDNARRIIEGTGADYVAGCPELNEVVLYANSAPHGLWARLERGERFDWLQPVAIHGSPVLAWRVVRPMRERLRSATARP